MKIKDRNNLDLVYEKIQHHMDGICWLEDTRRLRLSQLLLRDDNEQLRSLQIKDDSQIEKLRHSLARIDNQKDIISKEMGLVRTNLRLTQRKLENAEVCPMHSSPTYAHST